MRMKRIAVESIRTTKLIDIRCVEEWTKGLISQRNHFSYILFSNVDIGVLYSSEFCSNISPASLVVWCCQKAILRTWMLLTHASWRLDFLIKVLIIRCSNIKFSNYLAWDCEGRRLRHVTGLWCAPVSLIKSLRKNPNEKKCVNGCCDLQSRTRLVTA
jgi:hypothetical protein